MRKVLLTAFLTLTSLQARAERILIMGDSLTCGHFGTQLLAHLKARGDTATVYCGVSSAPKNWINGQNPTHKPNPKSKDPDMRMSFFPCRIRTTAHPDGVLCGGTGRMPTFESIMSSVPSDRVLLAFGTNTLPGKPDATYDQMIDRVNSGYRSCDFILPPHLQPSKAATPEGRADLARKEASLPAFYQAMQPKLARKCPGISSLAATAPHTPGNETGEGLHQTRDAAAYRMQHMQADIDRALSVDNGDLTQSPLQPRRRSGTQ